MKAIGYYEPGAIDRDDALLDLTVDKPAASGRDVLVRVAAVSVNPVDTKIRRSRAADGETPVILGWDAVGEVVGTGDAVETFTVGDRVWYAGAIDRPGTNAEYHLVDERIVARAPRSLDDPSAAAMPLTLLTAYEMLFDRLRVTEPVPGAADAVLIIGGAGGVGSVAIQLLKAKTDLTIIATASRDVTSEWAKTLGAHHVIDHSQPLAPQVEALGIGAPGCVFSTTHSASYVEQVAELIAPQGRFGLIDDPDVLDISPFKQKSISVHWELMYTRSLFGTVDMARQGEILTEIATLTDKGTIRSTMTETFGRIDAATLKKAHAFVESGKAKGKVVLEGF
ncbi:MAG: zinc-binding alcohol dehydrogenase family protein [Fulvimarina manganoxydans]|uniref:zinc-binding alcohol dehydrogenase family protein n=1 Tax=Fulvimarina manganoxydans TaxID=937218 RepID=UPI002353D8BB|nr:zinc-binding alcohol dehydrogenase family protein [Fulvimarina manganoxydans]MCK5934518.1 zinc-binding alcohol dehydrogenase family protein [Fulvimarina manganoxydans]